MATPFKGFEVIFTQKFGEQEKKIEVNQFFTIEKNFYEKKEEVYTEIKENLGLTITFRSQTADAQFFMDGLETLPERRMEVDPLQGEVYLSPSEEPVTLFDHTQEYYPLIPGLYRIVVVYHAQQFFSWVKVLPKQLDEAQWEIMRQEVEKELNGLARDFMLKKTGLATRIEGISQELLEQFFVINNQFSSFMAALSDLYRKVNYRINKEYQLVPKEKSRFIDERTVRYAAIHPENELEFKTPISAVTYDLPENRLAKKIIEFISKTLTSFIDGVEVTVKRMNIPSEPGTITNPETVISQKELEKLIDVAGKMRGAIQWIKTAPWYESVGVYQASGIPHVMNSDPRYRALFQLYRELNNEHLQLQIHKSFSYQWKRTDKLYEIWGFIQFIKALTGEELSFVPKSGWVYSQDFNGNNLLIPALPSNTEVVFRKGNLRINLVYEGLLPTQSKLTTAENPLYTKGTHTCPDGRFDVYENEIFIGTIIFDFKYRPRNAIWDENLIYSKKQNDVMRQLVSYGDHIHSPYLFGGEETSLISRFSPVQEVWAIYPNRFGQSTSHQYPDHKVCLIELTPGQAYVHLTEKIKEALEELMKTSKPIIDILLKQVPSKA
jgi:hypothetical protein